MAGMETTKLMLAGLLPELDRESHSSGGWEGTHFSLTPLGYIQASVQKTALSTFIMHLKEVSFAHQGCIYIIMKY